MRLVLAYKTEVVSVVSVARIGLGSLKLLIFCFSMCVFNVEIIIFTHYLSKALSRENE